MVRENAVPSGGGDILSRDGGDGPDRALRLIVEGGGSRPYYFFYVTVAIGELPREDALKGAPVFPEAKEAGNGGKKEPQDPTAVRVAQQTNTLCL